MIDVRVGEQDGRQTATVQHRRMPFPLRRGRIPRIDDDGFIPTEDPIGVFRKGPNRVDEEAYLRPYFLLNLSTRPSAWIIRSEPM